MTKRITDSARMLDETVRLCISNAQREHLNEIGTLSQRFISADVTLDCFKNKWNSMVEKYEGEIRRIMNGYEEMCSVAGITPMSKDELMSSSTEPPKFNIDQRVKI